MGRIPQPADSAVPGKGSGQNFSLPAPFIGARLFKFSDAQDATVAGSRQTCPETGLIKISQML
jgi:hypothetical protein